MLEKAKTSATRKDEHGLARMVFEGVDLTPDDAAQMKRIKARVAIEETIRVMMEKGADDEAIEKATLAIDAVRQWYCHRACCSGGGQGSRS